MIRIKSDCPICKEVVATVEDKTTDFMENILDTFSSSSYRNHINVSMIPLAVLTSLGTILKHALRIDMLNIMADGPDEITPEQDAQLDALIHKTTQIAIEVLADSLPVELKADTKPAAEPTPSGECVH